MQRNKEEAMDCCCVVFLLFLFILYYIIYLFIYFGFVIVDVDSCLFH